MTSLGTGPGVITPGEKSLGMEPNGFHSTPPPMNNYRPAGGMRGYNPPNQPNNMAPNNPPYYQQHKNNMKYHHNHNNLHHNHMNHNNHDGHHGQMNTHHNMRNNQNNMNNHGYEKSPVAPRFMKQAQQANQGMGGAPPMPMSTMPMQNEELSFRPPPNSMIKMIPQPMKPPPTFAPPIMDPRKSPVTAVLPPPVINNPPPPVENPLTQPGNKNTLEKKKKAPSKDDVIKKVDDIIRDYLTKKSQEDALEALKEQKIPERLFGDVIVAILNKAMDHNGK